MGQYIMSLDQGTTSSRCIIFDKKGQAVSGAAKEFKQYYPKPGWVEHNPLDIWESQIMVAKEAMKKAKIEAEDIAGIGITNQRETTVVWDKHTGQPVYNAIVWQCRRTADMCNHLKDKGYAKSFKKKTGLLIDAYFSATKISWILDHVPGARERANAGDLLFGTIDTWLIWNLTNKQVHVTDYSNAARTMLFNINTLTWDQEIIEALNIPTSMLPTVRESSHIYGRTNETIFGGSIPIGGAAGDQQASLFGQACYEPGMVKNTYGTGGFLLMNTGSEPVISKNGLITTIAWGIDGTINYALEGSIFVAGAAIQWLRDELKLIESASETESMSRAVEDTNDVYLVPAFVGLGAPYWDPYARGSLVGLTRGANRNHIVRATLESLAYQTVDVLRAMEEDSGITIQNMKVDGGACANDFLMEFQADILSLQIQRPKCIETTALGAAYLAGLAVGYWADRDDIIKNWQASKMFTPSMDQATIDNKLKGWHQAVQSCLLWDSGR